LIEPRQSELDEVDDESVFLVDESAFVVDVESVLVVDEPLSEELLSEELLSEESLSEVDFEPLPPWSFL
jgi:hypothetical protein